MNRSISILPFILLLLSVGCSDTTNNSAQKDPNNTVIVEHKTTFTPNPKGTIQSNLIELGLIYSNYASKPLNNAEVLHNIQNLRISGLEKCSDFVYQAIKFDNVIDSSYFLQKPTLEELKQIYSIFKIAGNQSITKKFSDSLLLIKLEENYPDEKVLLNNYYQMLFKGLINKNKPLLRIERNYRLDDLNLSSTVEKAIFFLNMTQALDITISGYMTAVYPPNTSATVECIQQFPKVNGKPYFYYTNFDFEDFNPESNTSIKSFKYGYLNIYYKLLVEHLYAITTEKVDLETAHALKDSSILTDRSYWKYFSDKQILEENFGK